MFHIETSILFAVSVCVGTFALYKWFKSLTIGFSGQLPSYKISLLSYITWFKKFNMATIHPLSLLLEYFCGFAKLFKKEGIVYVWFGYKPLVFAYKSEIVKAMLNNPDDIVVPLEKVIALRPLIGDGLLVSEGKKWHRNRLLLNPTFHTRILQNYMQSFNDGSEMLVNKMKALVNQQWVDLWPLFIFNSLHIICETAMGVKIPVKEDDPEIKAVIKACKIVHAISIYRTFSPWTVCDSIFDLFPMGKRLKKEADTFHNFCKKVMKEKTESLLDHKRHISKIDEKDEDNDILRRKGNAFLEHLLEYHVNNPTFTLEDVENEVYTFITAGHESVATSLNWIIYMLGIFPNIQEKVVQELNCIFGDDFYRAVTYEDLQNMIYLEKVIKEVMRIYPPVPSLPLKFKENKQIGSYIIPKDVTCVLLLYMLHRDPEVFPNPEKFNPERFSPENCKTRHSYSYMPFSMGQRNCIGYRFAMMEIKTVISHILRHFKVTSLDPRDRICPRFAAVLTNPTPLRIQLEFHTAK